MAVNNEHNPFCIAISYDYDKIKCKNKSNEKHIDPRNDKTINEITCDTQHPGKITDLHTVYGTGTHRMCWCYKCLRALISLIKLEQSYSRKAQKRTNSKKLTRTVRIFSTLARGIGGGLRSTPPHFCACPKSGASVSLVLFLLLVSCV